MLSISTTTDATRRTWCDTSDLAAFEYPETFPIFLLSLHHNDHGGKPCPGAGDMLGDEDFRSAAKDLVEYLSEDGATDNVVMPLAASPTTCVHQGAGWGPMSSTSALTLALDSALAAKGDDTIRPLKWWATGSLGSQGATGLLLGQNWTVDDYSEETYPKDIQLAHNQEGVHYAIYHIRYVPRGQQVVIIVATVENHSDCDDTKPDDPKCKTYNIQAAQIRTLIDVGRRFADDQPTFIAADLNRALDDTDGPGTADDNKDFLSKVMPLTNVRCATPPGMIVGFDSSMQLLSVTGAAQGADIPMGNYLNIYDPVNGDPSPYGNGRVHIKGIAHSMIAARLRFAQCADAPQEAACDAGNGEKSCVSLSVNDNNCGACGVQCPTNDDCQQGRCVPQTHIVGCPPSSVDCGADCSGNEVCMPQGKRCPVFHC